MRIEVEKNLRFRNQSKPIRSEDVSKKIKSKKAHKSLESAELDLNILVPFKNDVQAEILNMRNNRLTVKIRNFEVGKHVFPPSSKLKGIPMIKKLSKTLESSPHIPEHLDLQPLPKKLPNTLQVPPFHRGTALLDDKFGNQATTIFPPDNRMVFFDTSYPWSAFGRVDTPLGWGSGVMTGPRHLLTVSHVIQWNNNNTTGWIRFRPAFFSPSAPFGDAWGVLTYFKVKVVGPTIDWIEGMSDYVCVVLDRYLGNLTGWVGAKGYTDAWDGTPYWSHIGYPGDLTAGNRPTFQSSISLDGTWWQPDSGESMSHRGDVWPGQSGGALFGWWSNGPHAVSVQSAHNASENLASGGQDMVDLIIRARKDNP